MTKVHWTSAVSGSFETAADWSTKAVPGPGDDAILDAPGSIHYTVTASARESVASIQTAATATLVIATSTFTAANGTGVGANDGGIEVANGANLKLSGMVANAGSIDLASTGAATSLILVPGATTLTGGGTVAMAMRSTIRGSAAGATLTNVDNTISGQGTIGGYLTFINQAGGVVAGQYLTLNTSGEILTNAGSIEAASPRISLSIRSTTVDQTGGGVLSAGAGAILLVDDAGVAGGTLLTTSSGIIRARDAVLLDGTAAPVNLDGLLEDYNGTVTIQGSLDLASGAQFDVGYRKSVGEMIVGAPGATINGPGVVVLNSLASLYGTVSGGGSSATVSTLTNAGVISGGAIGQNLVLTNQGVVENCSLTAGNAKVLGSNIITNAGLLENVSLQNVDLTNSTSGSIEAVKGQVVLQNTTISGGALAASAGAAIVVQSLDNLINGASSPVSLSGSLDVSDGAHLSAQGALANTGVISISGVSDDTRLIVDAANLTLSGGGQVTLSDSAANTVVGENSTAELINTDNTISGSGNFGGGSMALLNDAAGVIDATGVDNNLILDTGRNAIANIGLIEATGGGACVVRSAVVNTGELAVEGGNLTLNKAVTGGGHGIVDGGRLRFVSTFTGKVFFTGSTGILDLGQSQTYSGTLIGFSTTGGTSLDLRDISFGAATTATYSGTTATGVLTVTDGAHTAHIAMRGNYLASTFKVSSDGHGGTTAVDPPSSLASSAAATFAQAMAGVGAGRPASSKFAFATRRPEDPILAIRHTVVD